MTDWVLNRWRRYGHDRLYAETPGGTKLGYLDLKTNQLHAEQPADLALLAAAVASYLNPSASTPGKHSVGGAASTRTAIYLPRHEVVDWDDLSRTAPGAAARERAEVERAAAPVRTMVARLSRVHTDERAWRIGAEGEEAVAAELATLGTAWRTVHAVPVGKNGADIDHVVVGPAGVFTVNAKHHPDANVWVAGDTFLVNGGRTHYVHNSRSEAARAARLLSAQAGQAIDVIGIIAVVGARHGYRVKEQPRDGRVVVVARKKIAEHLRSLPATLTEAEVDAIFRLASRSTTWHPASR